jgi:hypothetical protein
MVKMFISECFPRTAFEIHLKFDCLGFGGEGAVIKKGYGVKWFGRNIFSFLMGSDALF